MGEYEVLPNGLLPNSGPLIQFLDLERWSKAEERTAELIACIQPNSASEERRNAVADYMQRLIMKCFPCQVFTFGSVPLKTYLPDGDIDLTAFSNNQNLKDNWANLVRDILESEGKNENAEFRVKEVQYIQAEVKLIKCLVENIVVDISFNQLGGLCTLCFLEEVDHFISQNHLFKRSIILIKAWCYYESRVLGAHHGLISTYALETLVLYIFHVFNNSFAGPLEVLYRFLEFFSSFDWDNFCVSLWGPVPITSLPDVAAEPPRKDCGELLLSKLFLDACSSAYAVFPGGQENQGQQFVSKHFNVVDPLRLNNNLGRSVSKGNFFRIRSAFAFGAKKLARLLDCPKENLVYEVNQFFTNSWNRHGSGNRPDAPNINLLHSRLSIPDYSHRTESLKKNLSAKTANGNISNFVDKTRSNKFPSQNHPLENIPRGTGRTINQTQKVYGNLKSSRAFDQAVRDSCPKVHIVKGQKVVRPNLLVNDYPGKFIFARTRSSPELTDASAGFSPQIRHNKAPEGGEDQMNGPGINENKCPDAVESNISLNNYGAQRLEEEKQDLVNMMASTNLHSLNGNIHMPMNLASGHLPFPVSPSILASVGYGQRYFPGMAPQNIHFIDPSLSHMQFPHGFVSSPLAQYFPGFRLNSNAEDMVEPNNENIVPVEMNHDEADHDSWQDQDVLSPGNSIPDNRSHGMLQSDDKLQPSSLSHEYVGSSRNSQKIIKENQYQENGNNFYSDDKTTVSRLSSAGRSSSLRSRTSSESSWDGSPAKVLRTKKEKIKNKTDLTEPSSSFEKVINVAENAIQPVEDNDIGERSSMPHIHGYELAQTSSGFDTAMPMGPVLLSHGSRQRATDNSGVLFYPTGPPVPFLTMLPFYNVPSESGNSEKSTSYYGGEEVLDNNNSCLQNEELNTNSPRNNPDILNSDFTSHWQNLLFGRFCQNPVGHPSPVVVPPTYLQGRVPFDGPGRSMSANINLFNQLTGYGPPRLIPVASNRPPVVYQHYVEEIPRQRSGTGTYLPNLKLSPRERNTSGPRRGNYNYERKDSHSGGECSWNNTKSRPSGRNQNRAQYDKSNSRADRLNSNETCADQPGNSNRHDSFFNCQAQNSHFRPDSNQITTPNRASYNGPSVPSDEILYPFDHNANFETHTEQLELGSFGRMGSNEQIQINEIRRARGDFDEQRYRGVFKQRSSPDQPSSPHFQRSTGSIADK